MSGRTLHLRDGALITNRKTDRRQSPKRPLLDRLHELNGRRARKAPGWDARVGFMLPKHLAAFVSSGNHGIGVDVFRGFVQVGGSCSAQCFERACEFLAIVAKEHGEFTVRASIMSAARPGKHYGRDLTFWGRMLVVTGGLIEPRIYKARATCASDIRRPAAANASATRGQPRRPIAAPP